MLDLVFVHGLTGHREKTWTAPSGTAWPRDLLPSAIPSGRILSFGYNSSVTSPKQIVSLSGVQSHAQSLVHQLSDLRDLTTTSDVPIVFVAHSLGDLVVEDSLLVSKNNAESYRRRIIACTHGIAFLSTPLSGSDLAQRGKIAGNFVSLFRATNKSLIKALEPDSEILARIQGEFWSMMRARRQAGESVPQIECFYEEKPVAGIGYIVPHRSAVMPEYPSCPIHANHMEMTKFVSESDCGYNLVKTRLWGWSKALGASSVTAATVTDSSQEFRNQSLEDDGYLPRPVISQGHTPGRNPGACEHTPDTVPVINQGSNNFGGTNYVGDGRILQGNFASSGSMNIG